MNIPSSLQNDLNTISQCLPFDKLAVRNGALEISRSGLLQSPTRTVKNWVYGGYNRDAVVSHLNNLVAQTKQYLDNLKDEDIGNSYYTLKRVRKQIKEVRLTVSDMGAYYDDIPTDKKKFSDLFKKWDTLYQEFKGKLKENKPLGSSPPPDYLNQQPLIPSNLSRVKIKMSKGDTLEKVVKAAQLVEKKLIPTWRKVAIVSALIFSLVILTLPLSLLYLLKCIFWNPAEYFIRGKVTSLAPQNWCINNMAQMWYKYASNKEAQSALRKYTMQILEAPILTEEHIHAFSTLSKHATEVNLRLVEVASNDFDELMSYKTRDDLDVGNLGEGAKSALKQILPSKGELIKPLEFQLFVKAHRAELNWVDKGQLDLSRFSGYTEVGKSIIMAWMDGFKGDVSSLQARQGYFVQTRSLDVEKRGQFISYITPKNLTTLITVASKSSKVREIDMPVEGINEEISTIVMSKGFKLDRYKCVR